MTRKPSIADVYYDYRNEISRIAEAVAPFLISCYIKIRVGIIIFYECLYKFKSIYRHV